MQTSLKNTENEDFLTLLSKEEIFENGDLYRSRIESQTQKNRKKIEQKN